MSRNSKKRHEKKATSTQPSPSSIPPVKLQIQNSHLGQASIVKETNNG